MLQESFGGTVTSGPKTRKHGRGTNLASPMYLVEARFNVKGRSGNRATHFYREFQIVGAGRFFSITRRGLRLHDSLRDVPLDELVRLSQVAPLTGRTKRTLERYLEQGLIPPPDIPGGNGHAHLWYWPNIRPALSKLCNRLLPLRFPGARPT